MYINPYDIQRGIILEMCTVYQENYEWKQCNFEMCAEMW